MKKPSERISEIVKEIEANEKNIDLSFARYVAICSYLDERFKQMQETIRKSNK